MKGIFIIILVALMFLFPTTILAADPPDVKVDVVVTSEGSVDANIDLQGDSLNVSVNGGQLANRGDVVDMAVDTQMYITQVKTLIESLRSTLNQDNKSQDEIISLYGDAIAKLIVELQALQGSLNRLSAMQTDIRVGTEENLDGLNEALNASLGEIDGTISSLRADVINNSSNIELLKGENSKLRKKYGELSKSVNNQGILLVTGLSVLFCGLAFSILKLTLIRR